MIEPLEEETVRRLVAQALAEDVGAGDITTAAVVPLDRRGRGRIVAREALIVCGLPLARETFAALDPRTRFEEALSEGSPAAAGATLALVEGSAAVILTGERVALNFLQRLSGTATLSRQFADEARGRITVLDTRKTTPLLRVLEKYAVRVGGSTNHRFRLDDGILIKDNHVRLAGGVEAAVARARAAQSRFPIEVEAQSLEQVDAALRAGADIILLDNLSVEEVREAVARCDGRARTEISGGVTLDRLPDLAATGATFVSAGALTHSAPAADLSFEIEPL